MNSIKNTKIYISDYAANNLKEICNIHHRLLITIKDELLFNQNDIIHLTMDDDSEQISKEDKPCFGKLIDANSFNDFVLKIYEVGATEIYLFETTNINRVYYAEILLNEIQLYK